MLQSLSSGIKLFLIRNFRQIFRNFRNYLENIGIQNGRIKTYHTRSAGNAFIKPVFGIFLDRQGQAPGGKVIIISRKEAEEIRNFNLKSRRNKVAKQTLQKGAGETFSNDAPVINAEILENDVSEDSAKSTQNVTLRLISRIEELALDAGRFKQLEILRNEEKENVKFWQEKYHELNLELKKKESELNSLKLELQALKNKQSRGTLLSFFKKD